MEHGTTTGYCYYGCRCDACKLAWQQYTKRLRDRHREEAVPDHVHGTVNGYHYWGCRCDACRAAVNRAQRTRRRSTRAD